MKDPDSYRQQEGLKLTDEEKRRNRFPLRFMAIATILYLVFLVLSWFTFTPLIRKNFAEHRFLEEYRYYRSNESIVYPTNVPSVLIGENGLTEVNRELPSLGRDSLHTTLEALLLPVTEEERDAGLYSAIPEDTELIGASRKGKIVLIELSPEFMDAEDLEAASAQIRKTLSIAKDNLRVSIKVGDEII